MPTDWGMQYSGFLKAESKRPMPAGMLQLHVIPTLWRDLPFGELRQIFIGGMLPNVNLIAINHTRDLRLPTVVQDDNFGYPLAQLKAIPPLVIPNVAEESPVG